MPYPDRIMLQRSRQKHAGDYADTPRRIVGSATILPPPNKLPRLMEAFGFELEKMTGWRDAFEATGTRGHPFIRRWQRSNREVEATRVVEPRASKRRRVRRRAFTPSGAHIRIV